MTTEDGRVEKLFQNIFCNWWIP